MLSDFIKSRRQGLSENTLLFYQRCLGKAIGIDLIAAGINNFPASLTCGNGKFALTLPLICSPALKTVILLLARIWRKAH